MGWKPQARPAWAQSLNALGANLVGGPAPLFGLEQDELLATARASSGLDDFGDDGFHDGLSRYLEALCGEARLNTCGRLMARQDVLRLLQNRLLLAEHRKRAEPPPAGQRDASPIIVTGFARTGTTFLHELLACDRRLRGFDLAELMYPVPPSSPGSDAARRRVETVASEADFMNVLAPDFQSMHDNAADQPAECIFVFAHEFASDLFVGAHDIPSYAAWLATTDLTAAYRAHRDFLEVVAGPDDDREWVLKAPSHLGNLAVLLAVYPGARVVVTHRDPLTVLASLANLMATLRWMRSDHVDYPSLIESMAFGYGWLAEQVLVKRDALGDRADQLCDVRYVDLVADPVGTVAGLYDRWGLELDAATRDRITALVSSRGQGRHGRHDYAFGDTGLDLATERGRYREYQARFDVPSELE